MITPTNLRDLALDRDAVLWRNSGDLRTSVLAFRTLVFQVAYPDGRRRRR